MSFHYDVLFTRNPPRAESNNISCFAPVFTEHSQIFISKHSHTQTITTALSFHLQSQLKGIHTHTFKTATFLSAHMKWKIKKNIFCDSPSVLYNCSVATFTTITNNYLKKIVTFFSWFSFYLFLHFAIRLNKWVNWPTSETFWIFIRFWFVIAGDIRWHFLPVNADFRETAVVLRALRLRQLEDNATPLTHLDLNKGI